MPGPAGEGTGRRRILQWAELGRIAGERYGRLYPGFESGAGTEHRESRRPQTAGAPPRDAADAAEATPPGGKEDLSATQSDCRTGDRDAERTTRDAAVPASRAGGGGRGTGGRRPGLQLKPLTPISGPEPGAASHPVTHGK